MRWMLLLAAIAMTGCKTTEIVVAHQESGLSVTTRFDLSDVSDVPTVAAHQK